MDMSISIGMTTFNSEQFVEEQIESILNQSVVPNELVISDDASEDNTLELIKRIIARNQSSKMNIVLAENNVRQGYIKNFENAFKKTSGDIIISCDSDDIWFSQKVEKIKECFENPKVVYAFHDATIIDENKKIMSDSLYRRILLDWDMSKEDLLLRAIKRKGFPYGMTMAFRRTILKQAIPFAFAHDEWIWMCALALGEIRYIDEPLIYYRRHGNNTSGNNGESLFRRIRNTPLPRWFDYPRSYVDSYEEYRKRFSDYLTSGEKEEVEKQIQFRESLIPVVESSGRFRSLRALFQCYRNDYYKETRGNRKTFTADCIKTLIG